MAKTLPKVFYKTTILRMLKEDIEFFKDPTRHPEDTKEQRMYKKGYIQALKDFRKNLAGIDQYDEV